MPAEPGPSESSEACTTTPWWAIVSLVLVGFALRLYRIDSQSLWYDEAYSVSLARLDFDELIRATAADIHPPLYYAILRVWMQAAGSSELAVRYLSLLFGVLAIPLGGLVARQTLGRRAVLPMMALFAVSPFYVHYSQEARMYALVGVSTLAAVYFFVRAMPTGRPLLWAAYVVAMVAGLYAHLYSALILICVNVVAGVLAIVVVQTKGARQVIASFWPHAIAQCATIALFIPWIPVALVKFEHYLSPSRGSGLDWILSQTAIVFALGHAVLGITTFPGHPSFAADLRTAIVLATPFVGLAAQGAVTLVAGARSRSKSHQGATWPLTLWSDRRTFPIAYLLVPLVAIILLSEGRRDFNARYLFAASPAFYLLVVAGFLAVTRWRRRQLLVPVIAVALLGISGYALRNYYFDERYWRDDHRAAVAHIQRRALPEDVVVITADFGPAFEYYNGDRLHWVRLPATVPLDPTATADALAEIVRRHPRVWLIRWGDYFTDPEGTVQRWLDEHTFRADAVAFHGPVIVYGYVTTPPVGDSSHLIADTPPVVFGDQVVLLDHDVRVLEEEHARRVHLTLVLQARRPLEVNYSVFAHLLNGDGQVVGLGDSQPVNGYLPTSAWRPGEPVRSELDVWLHPGTPPGSYRLIFGVYDQATMRRLDTNGGDTVELGVVSLTARTYDQRQLDLDRYVGIRFGDAIELIGYRLRPSNDELELILYWRATQTPRFGYTVFNHLLDSTGQIVAQLDGEPNRGFYPTNHWQPGEIVRDEYRIKLPPLPSGRYQLVTGLYRSDTGERLPIQSPWPFIPPATWYEIGEVQLPL